MDLELTDKKAIVTGGSRGVGRAVALQLALEGADVGICARDAQRVDEAAADLSTGSGRRVVGCTCDTRDDDSVRRMVETMSSELGGVDILVNSAFSPGWIDGPLPLMRVTTEELLTEVDTKVMGYLRCAQEVVPHMTRHGWGRIINVGGLLARRTGSIGSIRNVAVAALTKNLADELGAQGINVTCVHPGATRTERMTDEWAARLPANVIGRLVEAEEIGYLVAFLASPKSAAITGDSIACGGGDPVAIHY